MTLDLQDAPRSQEAALANLRDYLVALKASDHYYDDLGVGIEDYDEESIFTWSDGAGNECRVILPKVGGYVFFGYDHESDSNFYTEDDEEALQMSLYEDMPEVFRKYITDSRLFWSFEPNQRYVYSSVAFWLTPEGELGYSEAAVEEHGAGGLSWVAGPLMEGADRLED